MSRLRRVLPPLASLLPFEAAARHESFTRAAAELNLTQAAVSRQIRALEQNVGTALFERGHRAVTLTDAGWRLARAVSEGLESMAACADGLRNRRHEDDIVVLAEIHVAMYWLIPRLPAFHAEHPDIRLRVNASTQPLTQVAEFFDIALQSSSRPSGRFPLLFSVSDAVFPICSPRVAAAASIDATDLDRYPILHCRDDPNDIWMSWDEWLDAVDAGRRAPKGTVFDNYPVVLQAALMGQGIGLGWGRGLSHLLDSGQLVRPMVERVELPQGLSIHAGDDHSAAGTDTRRHRVLDWLYRAMAA